MTKQSAPSLAPSSVDSSSSTLGIGTVSAPSSSAARGVASSWGMALALIALLGSAMAMAFVGLTVVPMETTSGYYFTDTPTWYQAAVLLAFGSLALCTLLGLSAIVLGIIGAVRRRGTARAVWTITLAAIAPVVALLVLLGTMALDIAWL